MFKSKAVLDYWLSMQAEIHEDEMLTESHVLTAEMRYHLNERFLSFDALWRDVFQPDLKKLLDGLVAELQGTTKKKRIDALRVNRSLSYFNTEKQSLSPLPLIKPCDPYLMALAELEIAVAKYESKASWLDGSLRSLRVKKLTSIANFNWSAEGLFYRSQALMVIMEHSLWKEKDATKVEDHEPMKVFSAILGTAFQLMYDVSDDEEGLHESADWLELMGLYRTFHDTITALPAAAMGTTKEVSHA